MFITQHCVSLLQQEFGISSQRAESILADLSAWRMRLKAKHEIMLVKRAETRVGQKEEFLQYAEGRKAVQQQFPFEVEMLAYAEAKVSEKVFEALKLRRIKALNLLKRSEIWERTEKRLNANPKMSVKEAIGAEMGGIEKVKFSQDSIDLFARSLSDRKTGELFSELKQGGLDYRTLQQRTLTKNITKTLLGKEAPDKLSGVASRIIREALNNFHDRALSAGLSVPYRKNYVPQSWLTEKLSKHTATEFADDMVKANARISDEFKSINELKRFFIEMHTGLMRGYTIDDVLNESVRSVAFKGKGLLDARNVIIPEPDDWFKIATKYGEPDAIISSAKYLRRNYHLLGLIERAGFRPEGNLTAVARYAMVKHPNRPGAASLIKGIKNNRFTSGTLKALWANVDRSALQQFGPLSFVQKGLYYTRWVQSVSKLGKAPLAALADIYVSAMQLQYAGKPLLETYSHLLKGIFSPKAGVSKKTVAEYVGVFSENVGYDIIARLDPLADGTAGRLVKLQTKFHQRTGLTPWTNHMRSNVAAILSFDLAKKTQRSWRSLPPEFKGMLFQYGIGASDLKQLRNHLISDKRGRLFTDIASLKNKDTRHKFFRMFYDQVSSSILFPQAKDMMLLNWGMPVSSIWGSLARTAGQFKAYPLTFARRHLWPAARAAKEGNVGYMAHLLVGSLVFGYLALTAKDIILGRSPRSLTHWKTWLASWTQGGTGGVYGDVLLSPYGSSAGDLALDLAGPTASEALELAGFVKEAIQGDVFKSSRRRRGAQRRLLKFAIDNTPGANVWQIRGALNYLMIYRMYDALDPSYLRRQKRYMEKDFGQTYLIEP